MASGEKRTVNVDACFTYLECPNEQKKIKEDLKRLESFARTRTPVVFTRGDVAETNAYNSVVRRIMTEAKIRSGGARTGVLQNTDIAQFEAGRKRGSGYVVNVSRHKQGKKRNASIVFTATEYERAKRFLAFRKN